MARPPNVHGNKSSSAQSFSNPCSHGLQLLQSKWPLLQHKASKASLVSDTASSVLPLTRLRYNVCKLKRLKHAASVDHDLL